MKYTDEDLKNLIALCEQEADRDFLYKHLENRCKKALAYRDRSIRIT